MKRKPQRPDPAKRSASYALVFPHPQLRHRALIRCGPLVLQCAIGRNGVSRLKREGDEATPAGRLGLLDLIVRRDRITGPHTAIPARTMRRNHIWDEDPTRGTYNRLLNGRDGWPGDWIWRKDRLYDVIGVLDWNVSRRGSYQGSAIFLHLCRPGYGPTAGCIALEPGDLRRLLGVLSRNAAFIVAPDPRKARKVRPISGLWGR